MGANGTNGHRSTAAAGMRLEQAIGAGAASPRTGAAAAANRIRPGLAEPSGAVEAPDALEDAHDGAPAASGGWHGPALEPVSQTEEEQPAGHAASEESCPHESPPEGPATEEAARHDESGEQDLTSIAGLLRLAGRARIIRGSDSRFYAAVPVGDDREIVELGSSAFEFWLIRNYHDEHGVLPAPESLNRLVRALQARAAALPTTEPIWVRVAEGPLQTESEPAAPPQQADTERPACDARAAYYLDVGDASRQAIQIHAGGCRVVSRPPVWFRRPTGQRPLPMPRWDGSIDLLKKYANVREADFLLLVAWMTAALRPQGPYPILIVTGEQGSAKSTMARLARRLVDPNAAPLRALPPSQRGFMIEARNTWLLAYDNISRISQPAADGLCRIATGGGVSARALHSNDDETLFHAERPALFTGIDDFVRRSDLVDRCVFLHLPPIVDAKRRSHKTFWTEFEADYPRILGGLLTAVAGGLRILPHVRLPALPRMADFAQWGEAVSRGLGASAGAFLSQYEKNRRFACESELEDSPVAQAIRGIMRAADRPWSATASEMLPLLTRYAPKRLTRTSHWPKTPRALSSALRRIAPALRAVGTNITFDRSEDRRTITIDTGEYLWNDLSLDDECVDSVAPAADANADATDESAYGASR
jgi:hypothetical protein